MECKQKAALIRAHKRSPASNIRNYLHGTVVDGIMRRWLADPDRRTGQMAQLVDTYIDECVQRSLTEGGGVVRWKYADDRAELTSFCVDLLGRLEPILSDLVLPYRFHNGHTFRQPVTVPYLDGTPTTIYLRGEMDLLCQEDTGRWAVWDLKGTKDNDYWRKVLGQLIFYDLAVYAGHATPTSRVGLIQPMCRKPVLQWQLGDDHRRQMWAAILRMAGDIWRADETCKDGTDGCAWCEVRHACVRYRPDGNTIPLASAATGGGA